MRNIALISAALAATFALPVQAEEIVRQREVRVTAADFATPERLAELENDLRGAARSVCDDHRPQTGPPSAEKQRCYQRAMAGARTRLAELKAKYGSAHR